MPITPFHFGLGAALHGAAPKTVSFIAFCMTNVLIDLESLYNLVHQREPVHAFFHTYVGATLMAGATLGLFLVARAFAARGWLPNAFGWRELTAKPVLIGALLGACSHVGLDSVMHADIRPWAPFSEANGLYAALSLDVLHLLLVALGVAGAALVGWRRWRAAQAPAR